MANTTLTNVVEELELQTEYLDLQTDNMQLFREQLQADKKQQQLDNLKNQEAVAEGRRSGGGAGKTPPKGDSENAGFASSFGSSFGGLAGTAAGLGALGVGIGAFFGGLALSDAALSYADTDMGALKRAMVGLGDAFTATDTKGLVVMGGLMAAGGAMGALFGPGKSLKAATGMAAIGLGIGGFFSGLALGSAGIDVLNTDASGLKNVMVNVSEGLNAFASNPTALASLGGLLAAGGLFALVPGGQGAMVTGMAAIGLGIGGFFAALALSSKAINAMGADGSGLKKLMVNTAEGLGALTKIDGYDKLLAFAPIAASVGAGIAALLGVQGIGAIGDKIASFFGVSEGPNIFESVAESLNTLMTVDYSNLSSFSMASAAIADMGAGVKDLAETDMDDLIDNINEIAKASAYAIPLFTKAWEGGTAPASIDGEQPEMDFGQGLKSVPTKEISHAFKSVSATGSNDQFKAAVNDMNSDQDNDEGSTGSENMKSMRQYLKQDHKKTLTILEQRKQAIADGTISERAMGNTTINNVSDNRTSASVSNTANSMTSGGQDLRPVHGNGSRSDAWAAA